MRSFLIGCVVLLAPTPGRAADPVDYTRDIKPLLARYCVECHGADKHRSDLRLDTAAAALRGGKSGPSLIPKKSAESRLILAVTGADGVKVMPQKGSRLSDQQIALLRAWIDAGAPAPADEVASKSKSDGSDHWAFRAPVRTGPPSVKDSGWVPNPIDRFILARLEKEQITPSAEADRATLIRRVCLDLTGLPPSLEEVDAYLADQRPDAYERLVDRLLASPHYGERWGRHWLDLARYADSNGFSIDAPRSIWKYRDWVIDAFNRDLPFDQFVIEQLAGDMLPNATLEQRIATGFHRNTLINQEGGIDEEQFRVESVVDRVNTTGAVFLGLTVGCAQCHDHKFDPVSQREFYELFAFFNNADEPTLELPTPDQTRKRNEVQVKIDELEKRLSAYDSVTPEKLTAWEGSLTSEAKSEFPMNIREVFALAPNGRSPAQEQALLASFRKVEQTQHVVAGLGGSQGFMALAQLHLLTTRRLLEKQIAEVRKHMPAITSTLVVEERKTPRETHVRIAGDFARPGDAVQPATPAVLPSLPTHEGLNRLDLAKWLVDSKHPLTTRVTLNRIWQHYFGLGLVETENDFGTQGTPPSHPELLDWLATEFIARGWSMKAMPRSRRAACSLAPSAAPASSRPNRRAFTASPRFRRIGKSPPVPTATDAVCTHTSGAPRRIRDLPFSTPRNRTPRALAAIAPTRRCKRSLC